MGTDRTHALSPALAKVLRALARVLLRQGMPYRVLDEIARKAFVDVAAAEFGIPGRKLSDSRVAVLTGLTRKEIRRLRRAASHGDDGAVDRYHRAARVVSGWVRDARYRDGGGRPARLPFEGRGATFSALVRRYAGDVPPRAVLDELVRVGVAARCADGRVRLCGRAYVPRAAAGERVAILGTDVSELIATIDHNLAAGDGQPFFQRKVAYDNLPAEVLPAFRALTARRAQALLERFDGWLAKRDRDVNPAVRGSGRWRAGVGIYYFEAGEPQGGNGNGP